MLKIIIQHYCHPAVSQYFGELAYPGRKRGFHKVTTLWQDLKFLDFDPGLPGWNDIFEPVNVYSSYKLMFIMQLRSI